MCDEDVICNMKYMIYDLDEGVWCDFLFQDVICIPFYMWCYLWCGIMVYYVHCSGSFLHIFRFGDLWGVKLSSSGTDVYGVGAFLVLYFAVVTLG